MNNSIQFVPNHIYLLQEELLVIEEFISYLVASNFKGYLDNDIDQLLSDYNSLYLLYLNEVEEYKERMKQINNQDFSVRVLAKKF